MTNLADAETPSARIAVAIPCFNEAAAIASVIQRYQAALPGAELFVFDNNSTDGTGEIARGLGVQVIDVPEQGKGHAVRAAMATLSDFDVVVLTDGDGTYPAEAAPLLVGPLVADAADMAVGARRPTPGTGAMSLTRGFGNIMIRAAFRVLIGPGTTDFYPVIARSTGGFVRPSGFAQAGLRSRPSWPVRRLLNGFVLSRSRFPIMLGSRVRRASYEHFGMADGF